MQGSHFAKAFPRLQPGDYHITSAATPRYNCIAWAAGNDDNWWWPPGGFSGYHWPAGIPTASTLENFVKAFESLGYQVCDSAELEPEVEKIAVYVGSDGAPTHAARQLASGSWTSKLGKAEDIEHRTLACLEDGVYGLVAQIMKRPRLEG